MSELHTSPSPNHDRLERDLYTSFDAVDWKILSKLRTNANITMAALAKSANVTPSVAFRRRLRMEEVGLITGYNAEIDPTPMGFGDFIILNIHVADRAKTTADAVIAEMNEVAFPLTVFWSASSHILISTLATRSASQAADVLHKRLRLLPAFRSMDITLLATKVELPKDCRSISEQFVGKFAKQTSNRQKSHA